MASLGKSEFNTVEFDQTLPGFTVAKIRLGHLAPSYTYASKFDVKALALELEIWIRLHII